MDHKNSLNDVENIWHEFSSNLTFCLPSKKRQLVEKWNIILTNIAPQKKSFIYSGISPHEIRLTNKKLLYLACFTSGIAHHGIAETLSISVTTLDES